MMVVGCEPEIGHCAAAIEFKMRNSYTILFVYASFWVLKKEKVTGNKSYVEATSLEMMGKSFEHL